MDKGKRGGAPAPHGARSRPKTARLLYLYLVIMERVLLQWCGSVKYSITTVTVTWMIMISAVAKKCFRRWYREKIWTWMTTGQSKISNNLALRYSRRLWCVEDSSVAVRYSSEPRDCSPWRDSATTTYLLHCLPNHRGNSRTRTFSRDFMTNAWCSTEHSVIHCESKNWPFYS